MVVYYNKFADKLQNFLPQGILSDDCDHRLK